VTLSEILVAERAAAVGMRASVLMAVKSCLPRVFKLLLLQATAESEPSSSLASV